MIRNKLDIYNLSGPTHLTAIDWNNADHRRSIVASLVQGVYVLEQDRQHSLRQEAKAVAPPCLNQSITVTILQDSPPKYVIAFRGNVLESYDTCIRDLKLDIEYYFNILHWDSRFELAIKKVEEMVRLAGSSANVWLAGHSLGLATLEISEHEPEDLHLLPSAHMFTNRGQLPASRRAHGIEQWWNPDTHCHPMVYQFKE
uniref:Fungal lipase-like domain-containing protein n=1 Tax=Fagus sylvatica TaxID=28930 RepID=A0A2N9FU22_FAGSY